MLAQYYQDPICLFASLHCTLIRATPTLRLPQQASQERQGQVSRGKWVQPFPMLVAPQSPHYFLLSPFVPMQMQLPQQVVPLLIRALRLISTGEVPFPMNICH